MLYIQFLFVLYLKKYIQLLFLTFLEVIHTCSLCYNPRENLYIFFLYISQENTHFLTFTFSRKYILFLHVEIHTGFVLYLPQRKACSSCSLPSTTKYMKFLLLTSFSLHFFTFPNFAFSKKYIQHLVFTLTEVIHKLFLSSCLIEYVQFRC